MSDLPVVILAGGLGTRVAHLTDDAGIPKALLPLDGRPFIDVKLEELAAQGFRRVVVLTGHRASTIADHVGDGGRFGLTVEFVEDGPELLGTGGAVKRSLDTIGPHFWLTYGDTLLDVDVRRFEAQFVATDALLGMTVWENHDAIEPSNITVVGDRVAEYRKGAPPGAMTHIDYGMLLFRREAFDVTAEARFDLQLVIAGALAQGRILAFPVNRRFYDIGNEAAWRATEAWLRTRRLGAEG